MILGFQRQFKDKILSGQKIHTIREDKTDRWKAGRKIHFAVGTRTPLYECFKEGVCESVQNILIKRNKFGKFDTTEIWIDGRKINIKEINRLSKNDGFDKFSYFANWFSDDFSGKIIHWTYKRY